jgi:hypothetical protein
VSRNELMLCLDYLLLCSESTYPIHDSRDSVDDSDTAEKYSKLLQEHIDRFEVVEKVMSGLNDTMVAFHGKVGGDIKKIEALFVDMAPEPQKGKPMPPGTNLHLLSSPDRYLKPAKPAIPTGMIHALLRVAKTDEVCSVEDFLECFRRNLDASDTVEKLKPTFEQHIAKY